MERHLLPTQILQKEKKRKPQTGLFQRRQVTDRRERGKKKKRTKKQGHMLGTGVCVPFPLHAKCFGKAGTQVDNAGKKGEAFLLLPWRQQSGSFGTPSVRRLCPFRRRNPLTFFPQFIFASSQKSLYTRFCIFFFLIDAPSFL